MERSFSNSVSGDSSRRCHQYERRFGSSSSIGVSLSDLGSTLLKGVEYNSKYKETKRRGTLMWLFTETGFVSAVCDFQDKNTMVVRARDKKSLEAISKTYGKEVIELSKSDYAYRVFLTKEELTDWMSRAIADANYTNYKSRMEQTRGYVFVDALHDVWSVMMKTTDRAKAKAR